MSLTSRLSKILIANRGEIACRVIRSAKKLGVQTVAVYSDADVNCMHVSMADEAYNIGLPPAQESYLKGSRIIEVAKKCGAVAIHPGYGFLSENAEFATLCQESGIKFIGPPASAIRDMGIKNTSKAIMVSAGVSVVPGYHGDDQSNSRLLKEARHIGFPLMIKAIRGGGGKGMRIVNNEEEFESALDSARRESLRAFGDDGVLLEKYVRRPRHIEVQVFGDTQGNYVYLFERDCSIQRRHQKVIEQAPAPGIDDKLRKELGEAAVRAAKAVGYVGAGTVEFIMDTEDNQFYFMEMNTRLQVEHPVTEMVTGVDLVEWQLRVAAGESLPVSQSQLHLNGHSVEARVYAEDVDNGFIPTAGQLHLLSLPEESEIRLETGVREGDTVSVFYDPMIAKVIVWDQTSEGALFKLEQALAKFNIVGVENNVDFLRSLCRNKSLQEGKVNTGFIGDNSASLLARAAPEYIIMQAALGKILSEDSNWKALSSEPLDPFNEGCFRLNHQHSRLVKLKHLNTEYKVDIMYEENGTYRVRVNNGTVWNVKATVCKEKGFMVLKLDDGQHVTKSKLAHCDNHVYVFNKERDLKVGLVEDWTEDGASGRGEAIKNKEARSPMPGVVEKVSVSPGQKVKTGDQLAVVMAMKMEYVIRAEQDGVVKGVFVKIGENVTKNKLIVSLE